MQTSRITLSSAQILALQTTGIDIVPAPGAGKVVTLVALVASLVFNSAAYANGSAIDVIYSGTAVKPLTAALSAAFVNSVASKIEVGAIGSLADVTDTPANIANKSLQLKASGAAFITGDSPINVTAFYNTATL